MALDYDQLIEAYKHPRHRGRIAGALRGSAANPSCGDDVSLYFLLGRNGKITDAKHDGHGCALSVATAEAICGYVLGKNLSEACALDYEGITELLGFTPSAGRVGCVMVALTSLREICEKGIKKQRNK